MSSLTYLFIFCALATGSLIVVSIVNEKENRRRIVQQKLRQLRFQVQDMEEVVLEIDRLVENRLIAKLLNDEILEKVLAMKQAHPDTGYLNAIHQTALARLEQYESDLATAQKPALDRRKHSDAQIARSKRTVEEAGLILRRQQSSGKITLEDLEPLMSDLRWAHLMIDVISHIGQGYKAMRRRDLLSAHAFYKKAQQMLIQSSHPDPRRQDFIKEISDVLNNRRNGISPRLMPEINSIQSENSGSVTDDDSLFSALSTTSSAGPDEMESTGSLDNLDALPT